MILIVGATGYLGNMITHKLLAQGLEVRVLVRSGGNSQPLAEAGAQPVIGDLQDPDSLYAACQGVDTVISTAATRTYDYRETAQAADVRGYQNLFKTAKAAGVSHFILVSAVGADACSSIPYIAAKGEMEADLRASGMDFTIIRPSYFMDFWFMGLVLGPAMKGEPVWVLGEGKDPHCPVVAGDVAEFVVTAVGHPAARNRVIVVAGPQPLSLRDAALVAERILGKPVPVKSFDPAAAPPELSPLTIQLMTLSSPIDFTKETAQAAEEFGIRQTSLDKYLQGILTKAA